jgi:hypothetical protein
MEEDELEGECSTHKRNEECLWFCLEILRERDHLEGLDVNGRILIKRILTFFTLLFNDADGIDTIWRQNRMHSEYIVGGMRIGRGNRSTNCNFVHHKSHMT